MKINYMKNLIYLISLISGFILTLNGLFQQKWPSVLPNNGNEIGYLLYLLLGFLIFFSLIRQFKLNIILLFSFALILTAILSDKFSELIFVLIYLLSAAALGNLAIKYFLKLNVDFISSVLIGCGVFGSVFSIAALFRINYSSIYLLFFLAIILYSHNYIFSIYNQAKNYSIEYNLTNSILVSLISILLLLHFSFSFFPELTFDGLANHLFTASYIKYFHKWAFNPEYYVLSLSPMLGDWQYAIVYLLGGEYSAKLLNNFFLLFLSLTVYKFVLLLTDNKTSGFYSVLILLSTPITFMVSSSLHIEIIWSCFLLSSLYFIFFKKNKIDKIFNPQYLFLFGIFFGFSLSTKSVSLLLAPIFAMFVLFINFKSSTLLSTVKISPKIILIVFLFGSIPYITSLILSGNPFFPFFNGIFKSIYFPIENFNNTLFNHKFSISTFYDITFNSEKYIEGTTGSSGFQWTLFILFLLALLIFNFNSSFSYLFILFLLSISSEFYFQSYLRYIYPLFALFSILIGISYSFLHLKLYKFIYILIILFCIILNLIFFGSSVWHYRDIPISYIFTPELRSQIYDNRSYNRKIVDFLNIININHDPVLLLGTDASAGILAETIHASWYNSKFNSLITNSTDPEYFAKVLRGYGVNYIVVNINEIKNNSPLGSNLEKVSDIIWKYNVLEIRKLKENYSFGDELLNNPSFISSSGWSFSDRSKFIRNNAVLVNSSSPVTQAVDVVPGEWYYNSVTFKCDAEVTRGRIQVNWQDSNDNLIFPNLSSFDCLDSYRTYSQVVQAPKGATKAIIYGSSNTSIPIIVSAISFRKK